MDRILTVSQAIREAIDQEMARDASVFVMGQGVDDFRGIYGTTRGLAEKYGADRCFDAPLSEEAMAGVAIGAAMAGMRPIQTHIRMDFMLLCMNQLINIAAKNSYTYGGTVCVPLVVRGVIGRSWGQGAQHSQALHSLFMHIPGLRVAAPTTPYDTKGLLTQAIRDNNPVIFVEHRMVHPQKGHVPVEQYVVPFGKARILAEGADVTIVGVLHAAVDSLRARACLAEAGVAAEVIDPVSLSPLDIETIAQSVGRTGHLLVVDSGWTCCGAGAEIITAVGERLAGQRAFKFKRMGFAPTVCPTTKILQDQFYPNVSQIACAAHALVGGDPTWKPAHVDSPEVLEFKGPF